MSYNSDCDHIVGCLKCSAIGFMEVKKKNYKIAGTLLNVYVS